jgi:hypothetical protein
MPTMIDTTYASGRTLAPARCKDLVTALPPWGVLSSLLSRRTTSAWTSWRSAEATPARALLCAMGGTCRSRRERRYGRYQRAPIASRLLPGEANVTPPVASITLEQQ